MSVLARPLTYDDLRQMPDDGKRHEIIDGRLSVSPAPSRKHQDVALRFALLLGNLVTGKGLGRVYFAPFDVRLSPHDVVQPDLLFVSNERLSILDEHGAAGAPDLVVEILSPSTRAWDEERKAQLYAEAGVRELWMVDPDEETVRLYILVNGRYDLVPPRRGILRSQVMPGLVVDVAALFAGLA